MNVQQGLTKQLIIFLTFLCQKMKESQIFLDAGIFKIGRKRSPEAWKSFQLYLFIF